MSVAVGRERRLAGGPRPGLLLSQLPRLSDVRENEAALFLPGDAESTRAYELARERFPSAGTPALIVLREPAGLSPPTVAAAAGLADWLTGPDAPDNVIQGRAPDPAADAASGLVSPDRTTLYVVAEIAGEPAEQAFIDTVDVIRARAAALDLPRRRDRRRRAWRPDRRPRRGLRSHRHRAAAGHRRARARPAARHLSIG